MVKKILICFCLLFSCNSWATSNSIPTILVVGDSLSAGYGIDVKQGWVELLRQQLKTQGYNYQVINASISGDTTSNGLLRLPPALTQYKPNIVIIELGSNDGLRGIAIPTTETNLHQMIGLALQKKAALLLLGLRLPPNYGQQYTQAFHNMYLQLAKKNNISVVPYFLAGVDDQLTLMQQDNFHPTAKAQKLLLKNVWDKLQAMLKKS